MSYVQNVDERVGASARARFGLNSRLCPVSGLCLLAFLTFVSVVFSPSAFSQQDSETSPAATATVAAMFLLFPPDGDSGLSEHTDLLEGITIIDLLVAGEQATVEKRLLDALKRQDEQTLVDIVIEYSLVIDMEKSSETTLALRSVVAASKEEQLASLVQNNRFEKVKEMLEQGGVDVNAAIDTEGFFAFTPITRAAAFQNMKIVELLLMHGADPDNNGDKDVLSALGHAVKNHNLEMTRLLLDAGASIDFNHKLLGREPLAVWAAQTNDLSLMQLLIERGADLSKVGTFGWTPLSEAIRLKHADMADFLVDLNDPRILTTPANPASFHNRFDGRFFPRSNALHLARHFLDATRSDRLVKRILDRTKALGGDAAASLLDLQARSSASELAYAELDLPDAIRQRQMALESVDVLSLDSQSDSDLLGASLSMLVNLHELQVIAGESFTEENREKAEHLGKINNVYTKWHKMLDIMTVASAEDAGHLIEDWQKSYGDPKQEGWNYGMLLSWADENIKERADRLRVYETIDIFRKVEVFK